MGRNTDSGDVDFAVGVSMLVIAGVGIVLGAVYFDHQEEEAAKRITSAPVAPVSINLAACLDARHVERYADIPPPTESMQCVIGPNGEILISLPKEEADADTQH